VTQHQPWIEATRRSHENLVDLTATLDAQQVEQLSYDDEWSIAQVASHLGSQAEIFDQFVNAGLSGEDPPGGEVFQQIWARWDAMAPIDQVRESAARNQALVERLEAISDAEAEGFRLTAFGSDLDLAGVVALRLGEHAVHTWDVEVALDPAARVADDAVALLLDTLATTAVRQAKATEGVGPLVVETSEPKRRFLLTLTPEVALAPAEAETEADLRLPAEALVRLVYGRLDPEHTPDGIVGDQHLEQLRIAFPGF
jgi:uncharacterized protein (TIGR03083 family)